MVEYISVDLTSVEKPNNELKTVTNSGSEQKLKSELSTENQQSGQSDSRDKYKHGLKELQYLYLGNNQITNLQPLVDNSGLGSGDSVDLISNTFSCITPSNVKEDYDTLITRGVNVTVSCNW